MKKELRRGETIKQYRNDIGTIEEVVMTYTKDVERLALGLIKMRLNYNWLKEDLTQQGFIGLIEAVFANLKVYHLHSAC
ncbi:hypothetical protein [Paenibacillus sp. N3.4]|uniref:hypothetical protein n=1 Tax=Paenibacillus sp. N3.4 TaxID=2603222 RepID=UPI0011CA778A|nr:hypothetical protein [Paenibacillus sp. N3.4]TXK83627.1 hypothetical protein FU659_12885 [Paenibacillus sp. N3.4]